MMKAATRMKPWRLALLSAWVVGSACASAPESSGDPTVVYLVRHAERAEDGTDDPPLNDTGQGRAETLARVLADARIDRIFSTDYQRTRSTADPVATALGLSVETYDGRDLQAFAQQLQGMNGRILVTGHSNTTPELVRLLGGDPIRELPEWEYDRLYVVVLEPSGEGRSILLRYGAPSTEPTEAM